MAELSFYVHGKRVAYLSRHVVFVLLLVFPSILDPPAIAAEPGRIATFSLAYICSSSGALLDGENHIGTKSPDPLAPSILGHCKYRSATPSKVQQPRAVVHLKEI